MDSVNIKVGDKVLIFQDTLTRKDFEGVAEVVEILNDDFGTWNDHKIIDCIVFFECEQQPYQRQIYLKPIDGEIK